MGLTPSWTKDLRDPVSEFRYDPASDTLVVGSEDGDGTDLRLYAGEDGTYCGRFRIEGDLNRVEYADAADALFVYNSEQEAYAIDPSTATVRWETMADPHNPIAYTRDYDSVAHTTDRVWWLSSGGQLLHCHNTDDGEAIWATGLSDEYASAEWLRRVDGTVILGYGGKYGTHAVAGVDPETGEEAWAYRPGPSSSREVVFGDDTVYATRNADDGHATRTIARIDPETGEERWTYRVDGVDPSPHPAGDSVFVIDDDSLVRLDADTGSVVWRSGVASRIGEVAEALYVTDGILAVVRYDDDRRLVNFDRESGETRWKTEIEGEIEAIERDADDHYVGTREGLLYRIDETGDARWSAAVDGRVERIETGADPVLVSIDGRLSGVSRDDGRVRWSSPRESRRWIGYPDHVVTDEFDEPIRVLDRSDGSTVFETGSEAVELGDRAVFVVSGGTLGAYPLSGEPNGSADDADSPASFCPNCGADVSVYEGPNFCPECGENLFG